jgi:hypothetical protein
MEINGYIGSNASNLTPLLQQIEAMRTQGEAILQAYQSQREASKDEQ